MYFSKSDQWLSHKKTVFLRLLSSTKVHQNENGSASRESIQHHETWPNVSRIVPTPRESVLRHKNRSYVTRTGPTPRESIRHKYERSNITRLRPIRRPLEQGDSAGGESGVASPENGYSTETAKLKLAPNKKGCFRDPYAFVFRALHPLICCY